MIERLRIKFFHRHYDPSTQKRHDSKKNIRFPLNEIPDADTPRYKTTRKIIKKPPEATIENVHTFPSTPAQKKAFCDQVKQGDLIIVKLVGKKDIEKVDPFIRIFQQTAKTIKIAKRSVQPEIVHVALVVGIDKEKGQVIISEAMP